MKVKTIGFVGWRGMVGQVLIQRLLECGDNAHIEKALFFSTTKSLAFPENLSGFSSDGKIHDAHDASQLEQADCLVVCQGSSYSKTMYAKLQERNWQGIWIDAASLFRMDEDSCLLFPPVNEKAITNALSEGGKKFIGCNCTVSLLLMAIAPLLSKTRWVSSMTYQAASGAGARHMKELVAQMLAISDKEELDTSTALELDALIQKKLHSAQFPKDNFKVPLAASVIPFIDTLMENGQSKEEWKAQAEANKLLNTKTIIPFDGLCVRIGALRSHSQALTIMLDNEYPLAELEQLVATANPHVKFVPNEPVASQWLLTPSHVSGTLDVYIGRVRKSNIDKKAIHCFTVGDQLLWGAAEPLRCMVQFLTRGSFY